MKAPKKSKNGKEGSFCVKRVFLIVLDSFGIGELPDAAEYGDEGSNTLAAVCTSDQLHIPHMAELGLFHIDGVSCGEKQRPKTPPVGAFARLAERSKGKDTTIGHWEIAGIVSPAAMPVFPEGFPQDFLDDFSRAVGRGVLCNKPYSGTQVIADYGDRHVASGDLIVYTSADSVFQIAAHEQIVPLEELYAICRTARQMLTGELGVGRVIARPFVGTSGSYTRTPNRHDFSLEPYGTTMQDVLVQHGFTVNSVGKIYDIFAGRGITCSAPTKGNDDGIQKLLDFMKQPFEGLCFVNLVDFDMLYGHRNDPDGYAAALSRFDEALPEILARMGEEDILMITADHGCDPLTPSTDHSREYVPLLIAGSKIKQGTDLGTRAGFSDIAATILDYFNVKGDICGESFLNRIMGE